MRQTLVHTPTTSVAPGLVQRECATCGGASANEAVCEACGENEADARDRDTLQAARGGWAAPRSVAEALRTPGSALDAATRSDMEARFRRDFSQVRVHTGEAAARSAADLLAAAYTVGRDIVFGEGRYAPNTAVGKRLLAHELAHVVQQGATTVSPGARLEVGAASDPAEAEADRVADKVMSPADSIDRTAGRDDAGPVTGHLPPRVARQSAAPAPTSPPAAAPAPCPHPINWVHTGGGDHGANAIRIPISWSSSTGNLADLSNCTVREIVTYTSVPNPPFLFSPPNPTILTVPAVDGSAQDTHSYPDLKTNISNPRAVGSFTTHQRYQWQCTGSGCASGWTDFPGQTYDITREVEAQFVRLNPWIYRITKTGTGTGNTFSLSREVEIPDP